MNTLRISTTGLLTAALVALGGPVVAQDDSGRPLHATLNGAAELEGGDEDGTGQAMLRLNQGQQQICFELTVVDIEPATAAHVHRGDADANGPPVVTLTPPTEGSSSGCVEVAADLVMEIRQNPGDFYVNVHNDEFSAGAIRGQLDIRPDR